MTRLQRRVLRDRVGRLVTIDDRETYHLVPPGEQKTACGHAFGLRALTEYTDEAPRCGRCFPHLNGKSYQAWLAAAKPYLGNTDPAPHAHPEEVVHLIVRTTQEDTLKRARRIVQDLGIPDHLTPAEQRAYSAALGKAARALARQPD